MLEFIVGFFIALAIAMSGVGAGTVTAPILILFLNMSPGAAVGSSLVYGAVVKLIAAPVYWYRNQVSWRVFGYLVLGGVPGVIIGSLLLSKSIVHRYEGIVYAVLGVTVILAAGRTFFPPRRPHHGRNYDRSKWLPFIAAPIGLEVGFSSAGAGALGTVALMNLTSLTAAEVVGTDLFFGLVLSIVGGGLHLALGQFDSTAIIKLTIGGIVGAVAGANLASRIPSRVLRYGLAVTLILLGGDLFYRGWSNVH